MVRARLFTRIVISVLRTVTRNRFTVCGKRTPRYTGHRTRVTESPNHAAA
jgi:hypothetical protein